MTLDQILEEARQLPAEAVAELVDRILTARHGGIRADVESSWKEETRRRIGEIESGRIGGISGDEVSAQIRRSLGR
jgi:hypothetical protein